MKKGILQRILGNKKGISALEYGLIAGAISIAVLANARGLGNKISNTFNNVGNNLN